jgi:CHASE2 domain-containing sensor protein
MDLVQAISKVWHAYPELQALTAVVAAWVWGSAGVQDLRRNGKTNGMSWILIGGAILTIAAIGFVVDHAWSSVVISLVGLLGGVAIVSKFYRAYKSRRTTGSS